MIVTRSAPIIVKRSYDEHDDYRKLLWSTFKQVYEEQHRGRKPFFEDVMMPLVRDNAAFIRLDDGTGYPSPIPAIGKERKIITDYVSEGEARSFDSAFLRFIDAFLQLYRPTFATTSGWGASLDEIGAALGEFLPDPAVTTAASGQRRLLERGQIISGLYEYPEIDTFQRHHGVRRCVAFQTGTSFHYLLTFDFRFDISEEAVPFKKRNLDIFYGFCLPGRDFSPVLMRSAAEGERLTGLLYAPGALVDLSGPAFDELTLEVFTTDKAHQGSRNGQTAGDAWAKTLEIHYGPRLRRFLTRVVDPDRKSSLMRTVDFIRSKVIYKL